MNYLLCLGFTAFVTLLSYCTSIAQSARAEYPIDQEIAACKADNPTTLGIIECDLKGFEQWSQQMQANYDLLTQQLDEDSRRILKDQQIAWEQLQKLQMEFNTKFYEGRGHSGLMMISSSKTEIVRNRALELKTYLDILNIK